MPAPWTRPLRLLALFPLTVSAWIPGVGSPEVTRGFSVDTSQRNEVISFYQAVYMASEGYWDRINWTGVYNSTAAGAEGTVSAAFVADVERRVNYFRAMCGVKANVQVNSGAAVRIQAGDPHVPPATTLKSEAAQRSALMIVRSGSLSHNPPPSTTAWTTAAWNGNRNGNLALGYYGPGAVDAYFKEDTAGVSGWNVDVGHRRWLLFQWSTDFATGDTPGSYAGGVARAPSNSLYVVPQLAEFDTSLGTMFEVYPPAGYFPAPLNSPFWSLSYPGADFSTATVTLRDAAMAVEPVTIVSRLVGLGNNSIVWQVPEEASVESVGADLTWNVTVSGIQGVGVPTEHSYQVTFIDPNRLDEIPVVTGDPAPPVSGGLYQVGSASGADEVEAGMFLRRTTTWTEGAEPDPAPAVIDRTSGTYAFLSTQAGYVYSGSRSFRLTFPTYYDPLINGVPEQSFELDRELVPGPAGTLDFKYRRGPMTGASKLAVEYSNDGGLVWSDLVTPISGLGNSGDSVFQSASLPLPAGANPLRVRFRLFYVPTPGGTMYSYEADPSLASGIFIDDITTSGCDWLEPGGTVRAPGLTSFTFDSATAGIGLEGGQEWWLRARAVLGGHEFPYGPALVVNPVGPLQLTGSPAPPVTGANYRFIPEPGAESYLFEVLNLQPASWTEGAETLPDPAVSDATAAAYDLSSSRAGFIKNGAASFRLGLSDPADDLDHFGIERTIVPSVSSELRFWTRRGKISKTNFLHAEISTDDGGSWTSAWSLAGNGNTADGSMSQRTVPLAAWAGVPVKFRFAVRKAEGGVNAVWDGTTGVWIDDISVSAASEFGATHETAVDGTADLIRLDAAAAGQALVAGSMVEMRLRPVTGGVPGGWGPVTRVVPTALPLAGFEAWQAYDFPGLEFPFDGDDDADGLANGVEYAFSLNPWDGLRVPDDLALPAGRLEISRDLPVERTDLSYGAEWTDDLGTWSSAGVVIDISGGRISASAPKGAGERFIRWKITAN